MNESDKKTQMEYDFHQAIRNGQYDQSINVVLTYFRQFSSNILADMGITSSANSKEVMRLQISNMKSGFNEYDEELLKHLKQNLKKLGDDHDSYVRHFHDDKDVRFINEQDCQDFFNIVMKNYIGL